MEIINVHGTDTRTQDIVKFLMNHALFSKELAEKRAKEAAFVATDNGEIIATCSGKVTYVEELKGHFYVYRAFTEEKWRNQQITVNLLKNTIEYFSNNRMQSLLGIRDVELNGIYIVFENPILNTIKEYVSKTGLVLIGFTAQNQQKRVFYFEGSKFI